MWLGKSLSSLTLEFLTSFTNFWFVFNYECVTLCDSSGNAKTHKFHVIVPYVLHLDLHVELFVLVPNLVLGAAKNFIGRERAFETKTPFGSNRQIKTMLQGMENDCG